MAQVTIVVDRHAADVHTDLACHSAPKNFFLTAETVINPDWRIDANYVLIFHTTDVTQSHETEEAIWHRDRKVPING